MKRSGWIKRGKRLKPIGRRGKRMRENGEVFGPLADWIRECQCLACGISGPDPHHVKSRGAGFKDWLPNGDGNLVPLCRRCHAQVHATCFMPHGIDLVDEAKSYGEAYLAQQEGTHNRSG